ncbi:MAG: class I SAM-dependent methyltransferase [Gemmatimonadota bacterium]
MTIRVFAPLADDYAAARPGYPASVFDALLDRIPGREAGPPPRALDVAAGAGAATRGLLGRGLRVAAVEPALEMLRPTVRQIAVSSGWLGGLAARAEALPVRDSAAAAIVVAQAFHWLDPDPALEEFARVLVPGGVLLVLWNVTETDSFTSDVWEIVERFNPGHKRPVTPRMRATPETLATHAGFNAEPPLEVRHARHLSASDYLRYARSWSYVGGAMDRPTLAQFTRRLERVVASHHGDGPVRERFIAVAHFARRV